MDWISGPQTDCHEMGRCAADCKQSQLFNQCYFPLTCNNIQVSGLGNTNPSPWRMIKEEFLDKIQNFAHCTCGVCTGYNSHMHAWWVTEAIKQEVKSSSPLVRLSNHQDSSRWVTQSWNLQYGELSRKLIQRPILSQLWQTFSSFFMFLFFFCRCHGVKDFCPVMSPMVIYCICVGQLWQCIVLQPVTTLSPS